MTRPRGLGRGLDALIPVSASGEAVPELIPVDQVRPSADQPRRRFEPGALRELADSIRAHGLLQPVLVRRLQDGYELIAGERRWRAARQAGLARIPALVRTLPEEEERLVLGLVENLQREDLDPVEEARGIQRLLEMFSLTHEQAAERLGRGRVSVTQALRLLTAAPAVQSALSAGAISAGHGRAIAGLPGPQAQELALRVALERRLSVRQMEAWVKRYRQPPPRKPPGEALKALAQELEAAVGLPVGVSGSPRRGTVSIRFASSEELERIRARLSG
ncbi:MAG: ParB/RepB/Spo0J family partition protein [Candidatus Dormibacterales bacterium]